MKNLFFRINSFFNKTYISLHVDLVNASRIRIGRKCRIDPYCYLKGEAPFGILKINNEVIINRYTHVSAKNCAIEIGEFSCVGYNNWIGGMGNIFIGKNFMSGMNVVIISSNHDYQNIKTPYHTGKEIAKDIVIGDSVWIGANSTILPGVIIGSGSVIGAGSVVTDDIPENVLAVGVPAKILHSINRNTIE